MAVLLPDCLLGVRRALLATVDGHGDRLPGGWGPLLEPRPGRAAEGPDAPGPVDAEASRTWTLALDPALWPVARGDLVVEPEGRAWVVMSADLLPNTSVPEISYIRVLAHSRDQKGTRP